MELEKKERKKPLFPIKVFERALACVGALAFTRVLVHVKLFFNHSHLLTSMNFNSTFKLYLQCALRWLCVATSPMNRWISVDIPMLPLRPDCRAHCAVEPQINCENGKHPVRVGAQARITPSTYSIRFIIESKSVLPIAFNWHCLERAFSVRFAFWTN